MTQDHSGAAGRAAPSRRVQLLILAAVAGLLVLVWGIGLLLARLNAPPPVLEHRPPPGTFQPTAEQWSTLTFATAAPRDFAADLTAEGKVAADDDHTSQVFSPYSGHVLAVMARAGDHVRRGQALFSVEASEFVQGQNDIVAALAQMRLASAAEARQQALLKFQGAAVKDVQQSEADLTTARATLEAARNRLRILGASAAQISRVEKEASGAPMGMSAVVPSPITGTIIQRAVGPGQNLASLVNNGGGTPAFVVSDLRRVWLLAAVPETEAASLKLGAPITARVLAFPGRTFSGRIDFIAPTIDPNSRRLNVRATIENPTGELRPEMFASFSVTTGPSSKHLAVPAGAVVLEGEEARVWVAREGRALEVRKIRTGETRKGFVEVLAGLRPGDRVVDSGSVFIDRAATSE